MIAATLPPATDEPPFRVGELVWFNRMPGTVVADTYGLSREGQVAVRFHGERYILVAASDLRRHLEP